MRVLSNNDVQLFKQIASLSDTSLLKTLNTFLEKRYDKVKCTSKYVIAEGNIPIVLVAHLDTVFPTQPEVIYHDKEMNVMWSPDGLGADDRAGVFTILKIIRAGLKPHIIFTMEEETGGKGAYALVNDFPECPFDDVKYIIELDRQGFCDCVFYNCRNTKFTNYIESFGFMEDWGSFSDISVLCPSWKIAGVNLSVGYMNEHNYIETLHLNALSSTIDKVICMLNSVDTAEKFEYIHSFINPFRYNWHNFLDDEIIKCDHCGKEFFNFELVPVKAKSGRTDFYCPDCIASAPIQWCATCYEAYELDNNDPEDSCECKDCRKMGR